MDINLTDWPDFLSAGGLEDFSNSSGVRRKFKEAFNDIYENPKLRGWDTRFMFSSLKNGAVAIVPNVNLIKNIGFGSDASHAFNTESPHAMLETFNINLPLKHPSIISRNLIADEFESITTHYKRSIIEKIIYYSFTLLFCFLKLSNFFSPLISVIFFFKKLFFNQNKYFVKAAPS